jgi:hypothetical protein
MLEILCGSFYYCDVILIAFGNKVEPPTFCQCYPDVPPFIGDFYFKGFGMD